MKLAFAGTPGFGAHVLTDLVDRGLRPTLVVSQPDRPAGRGRHATPPPVAVAADQAGLPLVQTADINHPEVIAALEASGAECLLVAAFGQLLRDDILARFLCVNVHASLLPHYRGAAPIVRALMAGEPETGVSIMRMTRGLDEGPWALQRRLSISVWDDAGSLGRALALTGALAAEQVLQALVDGTARWSEQPIEGSYAAKLGPGDRLLDARLSARRLHDRVRALAPAVGCEGRTEQGFAFKVWRSFPEGPEALSGDTGRLAATGQRLFLGCADGALELLTVQPSGKRSMRASEFLRGYGGRLNDRLACPHEGGGEGD